MPTDLSTLKDRRSQYPGPPSRVEIQPNPAIQADMSEKPDCGETSYKGSGWLAGRKALLTGADSGMGRAAAIAFAREGADVAICYLPEEQEDAEEVAKYIQKRAAKPCFFPAMSLMRVFVRGLLPTPLNSSADSTSWSTMPARWEDRRSARNLNRTL